MLWVLFDTVKLSLLKPYLIHLIFSHVQQFLCNWSVNHNYGHLYLSWFVKWLLFYRLACCGCILMETSHSFFQIYHCGLYWMNWRGRLLDNARNVSIQYNSSQVSRFHRSSLFPIILLLCISLCFSISVIQLWAKWSSSILLWSRDLRPGFFLARTEILWARPMWFFCLHNNHMT